MYFYISPTGEPLKFKIVSLIYNKCKKYGGVIFILMNASNSKMYPKKRKLHKKRRAEYCRSKSTSTDVSCSCAYIVHTIVFCHPDHSGA